MIKSISVNKHPSFRADDETKYPLSFDHGNSSKMSRFSKIPDYHKPKVVHIHKYSCFNCNIDL